MPELVNAYVSPTITILYNLGRQFQSRERYKSIGMEWLRQWFTPTEEQALLALTPSAALSEWLTTESNSQSSSDEAPCLISGSWGLSLISHIRSLIWNDELMQRGYEQYQDGIFKVPFVGQWITVTSSKFIDEIVHAPETHLSFQEALNQSLQLEHLVGKALSQDQIHLSLIRTLNRNLNVMYPEILDESEYAFSYALEKGKQENGWISVKGLEFVSKFVYGLNQRVFVGLPLCRDEQWRKDSGKDQLRFGIRAYFLRAFSESKRGDANEYLSRFTGSTSATEGTVAKLIKERLEIPEENRPNDLISWILSRVNEENPEPKVVSGTLMMISLVAQGTTSTSLGHALYWLVSHPECIETLRQEILDATTLERELTFESLGRMRKLDSFIRETQRISAIGSVSLTRTAVQDFFFSNGVRIPAGEMVATMLTPVHQDAKYYPDPLEFKPWRFYELALADEGNGGKATIKYDIVTPSKTYLTWGLGRHACPGRWFAAMIMKHAIAYMILNYEFKLPDSAKGQRPADLNISGSHIPNTSARLLFRRKETSEWTVA